jgi:hypothetical protein
MFLHEPSKACLLLNLVGRLTMVFLFLPFLNYLLSNKNFSPRSFKGALYKSYRFLLTHQKTLVDDPYWVRSPLLENDWVDVSVTFLTWLKLLNIILREPSLFITYSTGKSYAFKKSQLYSHRIWIIWFRRLIVVL